MLLFGLSAVPFAYILSRKEKAKRCSAYSADNVCQLRYVILHGKSADYSDPRYNMATSMSVSGILPSFMPERELISIIIKTIPLAPKSAD